MGFGVWTANLRGRRRVCYHCATMAPWIYNHNFNLWAKASVIHCISLIGDYGFNEYIIGKLYMFVACQKLYFLKGPSWGFSPPLQQLFILSYQASRSHQSVLGSGATYKRDNLPWIVGCCGIVHFVPRTHLLRFGGICIWVDGIQVSTVLDLHLWLLFWKLKKKPVTSSPPCWITLWHTGGVKGGWLDRLWFYLCS